MPAKPTWYSNLDNILQQLRELPGPFLDRPTVELLLGVGRRRAQQIMAPCISYRVGTNGLADREAFIAHLQNLSNSDTAVYEIRRRRRVAAILARLRQERLTHPQLLVEAPIRVVDQQLKDLPDGVRLERGRITVEFDQPHQALEKLLALAMAIGNDFELFASTTQRLSNTPS